MLNILHLSTLKNAAKNNWEKGIGIYIPHHRFSTVSCRESLAKKSTEGRKIAALRAARKIVEVLGYGVSLCFALEIIKNPKGSQIR